MQKLTPWTSDYKSHQGTLGMGIAIAYYTSKCMPISIPLNDTQGYDLVVDFDGTLKRVQVKTTQAKNKYGNFVVQVHNTGGASGKSRIKKLDHSTLDILFCVTSEGSLYEIPVGCLGGAHHVVNLSHKMDEYKVELNWVTSAQHENVDVEAR